MRQLLVDVPAGRAEAVLRAAQDCDGTNLTSFSGAGPRGRRDLVIVHLSNSRVEGFVTRLGPVPDVHLTLIPQGVITMRPPVGEAPEQTTDVEPRSPFEIFFSGLQSIGSWGGFLAYAAVAGLVVWIGLFTSTPYLLVAAMLLAPFAGPAMTIAMGTARGDGTLIRRGLGRYVASIGVTVAISALMSVLMGQKLATLQMTETSTVSSVAVILPLAAGAAGAINLVQSERSSLVSGAAVGMLVAAALAPPAGLIGMAAAIGEWPLVQSGAFLLLLQLLAINVSGAVVFRLYGLSPQGARFDRGKRWLFPAGIAASAIGLGAVLYWQFARLPDLQRATLEQRAAVTVKRAVEESGLAQLVESDVRFTRSDIPRQETLLVVVYVQRAADAPPPETIRANLTRSIQQQLLKRQLHVTPLVDVSVLEPPDPTAIDAGDPKTR